MQTLLGYWDLFSVFVSIAVATLPPINLKQQKHMLHRRRFLQMGSLGAGTFLSGKLFASGKTSNGKMPLVISTWDAGINANKGAWEVLRNGGRALDAVERRNGYRI